MKYRKRIITLLFLLPIPVLVFSLGIGASQQINVFDVVRLLFSSEYGDTTAMIVYNIRLPRVLLVFMVGASLAVSGAALQAIFRNPLVCPYVLGLSSGAAFGAALALAVPFLPLQFTAFVFGLVAVAASYTMARRHKTISVVSLILAGIIVNGIFVALFTIVQFVSDPFKLQTIVHWTMGNFHNANWQKVHSAALPVVSGMMVILLYRWRLNVIALGDIEAKSAGAHPERDKVIILFAATIASSAAVAVAGIISLYGLVIPHCVRMIAGVDNRRTIPINLVVGGSFLVLIDDLSRTIMSFEIPIGVFTMLIGAPFFIYLMKKTGVGWEK